MSVEMINAILIGCPAKRLCHIMKQHGKAKHPVGCNIAKRLYRMVAYGVAMMRMMLLADHHPVKLRQKNSGQPRLICRAQIFGMCRDQKLDKIRLNALGAYLCKRRRKLSDRGFRLLLNEKSELCSKTHGAQHPQCVLRKTLGSFPDAADHTAV